MIRRESINGHATIMATLDPKQGAQPQTDDGKLMRNFKARAWVSESDYELVRIEIEAVNDLSFGLGLLARVHKGTVATFERRKVNNEVWLPAKVTGRKRTVLPCGAAPRHAEFSNTEVHGRTSETSDSRNRLPPHMRY